MMKLEGNQRQLFFALKGLYINSPVQVTKERRPGLKDHPVHCPRLKLAKSVILISDRMDSSFMFRYFLKIGIICLFFCLTTVAAKADKSQRLRKKANQASVEFAKKASVGTVYQFKVDTLIVSPAAKTLKLEMDPVFAIQSGFQTITWPEIPELFGFN